MTTPRLQINLDKIFHNARTLVGRLANKGISVTGVSKAALGSPEVAGVLLAGGVTSIGDSRIENIEVMRDANVTANILLTRSPMLSQVARVVTSADMSLNTELDVICALSDAAGKIGRTHGVLLMVELGDLCEGIMPAQLEDVVRRTLKFPNITIEGIGTNLACRSGVIPDAENMAELS
jgi:predicted amino acid racemase